MKSINFFIACVWFCFGLFGKIIPDQGRHELIISEILPQFNSSVITNIIGFSEIGLAIIILTGAFRKQVALAQISIILIMNTIEQIIAPHHLLFGIYNLLFAVGFCSLIYFLNFKKDYHYV